MNIFHQHFNLNTPIEFFYNAVKPPRGDPYVANYEWDPGGITIDWSAPTCTVLASSKIWNYRRIGIAYRRAFNSTLGAEKMVLRTFRQIQNQD